MWTSFDGWLEQVNTEVQKQLGVGILDLPDQCWRDWHDNGLSPDEACEQMCELEQLTWRGGS